MIYYIGIDISKHKHDFCIISNTREVIVENSIGYHNKNTCLLISTYVSIINNLMIKLIPTIIEGLNPRMLAFVGLKLSIIQSGTIENNDKMVKHGSGHLRYSIMNAIVIILRYSHTFLDYYLKNHPEGKCNRTTLSQVCKKLLSDIYFF